MFYPSRWGVILKLREFFRNTFWKVETRIPIHSIKIPHDQTELKTFPANFIKKEEELIFICDLNPSNSFQFDEETNEVYELLKEEMKKYCDAYKMG